MSHIIVEGLWADKIVYLTGVRIAGRCLQVTADLTPQKCAGGNC